MRVHKSIICPRKCTANRALVNDGQILPLEIARPRSILLAVLGIALIGFAEWSSAGWVIYLVGFTALVGGLLLLWTDPSSAPIFPEELGPEPRVGYLGRFKLNGYSLKAYERETDKGDRQFRLIACPPVTIEREAAFIRYLVNEGFVENVWRGMSKKLEEEANWAFFQ